MHWVYKAVKVQLWIFASVFPAEDATKMPATHAFFVGGRWKLLDLFGATVQCFWRQADKLFFNILMLISSHPKWCEETEVQNYWTTTSL